MTHRFAWYVDGFGPLCGAPGLCRLTQTQEFVTCPACVSAPSATVAACGATASTPAADAPPS